MPRPRSASSARAARRLGVLLTGGTIGAETVVTGEGPVLGLLGEDRDNAGKQTPETALIESAIARAGATEVKVVRPLSVLSENLVPADWVRIARAVRELLDGEALDGVLILHGTDTMAYTAAALSFLLADVRVPIVLSGSNLPVADPRSDAARNLDDALVALDHLDRGTYIAFAGGPSSPTWVHVGTRVRKARASGPAFVSINRRPAGKVLDGAYRPIHPFAGPAQPTRPLELDDRVLALRLYPGLDFHALTPMVEASSYSGVVLELYASATAPVGRSQHSASEFVSRCRAQDLAVICAVPASPVGASNLYESTVELRDAGAVFARDMLPETAIVKLMWVLAQVEGAEAVSSMMLDPVAEELRGYSLMPSERRTDSRRSRR